MRYFTSSTGNGSPWTKNSPNFARKSANPEDSKMSYHLYRWDNRHDRMMMAQPNWQWPSRHIRMFVNGKEVRDGDIFHVKPGLYPVMCWIPVRGGYNLQAPHFREVSTKELTRESPTFSYKGFSLDHLADEGSGIVHYLAEALSEQVRLHVEHSVDSAVLATKLF